MRALTANTGTDHDHTFGDPDSSAGLSRAPCGRCRAGERVRPRVF